VETTLAASSAEEWNIPGREGVLRGKKVGMTVGYPKKYQTVKTVHPKKYFVA